MTSDGSPTPAEDVMDEDDAELNDHDSDSAGSFHAPTEIDAESVDASTTSSSTLDSESPDTHHKTPEGYSSKKKVTAGS